MSNGDKPTIETPKVVADLAEEMAEEATEGDGKVDGRVIVPRLVKARARIVVAIEPMRWLGFDGVAAMMNDVAEEISEVLQGDEG